MVYWRLLWTGFSLSLCFPIQPAHQAAEISLSANETASLDPSAYFRGPFSDFFIRPSDSPRASLQRNLLVKEQLHRNTDVHGWHFGPSVTVDDKVFFCLVAADMLQVWSLDDLHIEWEEAVSVIRVMEVVGAGFAYFTSLGRLFYLTLSSSAFHVGEVRGVDTSDVLLLEVCSVWKQLATVRRTAEGSAIAYYSVNWSTLVATLEGTTEFDEVVDVICTSRFYFLTSSGLLLTDNDELLYRLPTAFGPFSALLHVPGSKKCCVVTSQGLMLETDTWIPELPGVSKVLSAASYTVVSKSHSDRQFLVVRNADDSEVVVGKWGPTAEFLWVPRSGSAVYLAVLEYGHALTLSEVVPDKTRLFVSSPESPYSVQLCAYHSLETSESACVDLRISCIEEETPIMFREQDRIYPPSPPILNVAFPFIEQNHGTFLLLSELISAPNLNSTFAFSNMPPSLVVIASSRFEALSRETVIELASDAHDFRLLCAAESVSVLSSVYYRDGNLLVLEDNKYILQVHLALSRVSCALHNDQLYLYGEDSSKAWLYHRKGTTLMKQEVAHMLLTDMLLTDSHLLLVTLTHIDVLNIRSLQWHRLAVESIAVRVCEKRVAVLRRGLVEFYAVQSGVYVSQMQLAVPPSVTMFTYSREALVTLSENRLTMFDVSNSFRVTEKYSIDAPCLVTDLMADANLAVFACEQYYQIISLDKRKHAAEVVRIPRTSLPLHIALFSRVLYEFSDLGSQWRVTSMDLRIEQFTNCALTFIFTEHYEPTEIISFQGDINLTSWGDSLAVALNVTLVNSGGAVLRQTDTPLPSMLTVPWGESYTLSLGDFVEGSNMHFSVSSSDPSVSLEVQNAVQSTHSLPIVVHTWTIGLASDLKLVFTVDDTVLSIKRYVCEGSLCHITSEQSVPLVTFDLAWVSSLEVLAVIQSTAYLYLTASKAIPLQYGNLFNVILRYDSESHLYAIVYQQGSFNGLKCHAVKETEWNFHVFIYGEVLDHCEVKNSNQTQFVCHEVVEKHMTMIMSVGSEFLRSQEWRVYAITAAGWFFSLDFQDVVVLARTVDIFAANELQDLEVAIHGNIAAFRRQMQISICSIPDFTLVKKMTLPNARIRYERSSRFEPNSAFFLVFHNVFGTKRIIDLNAPPNSERIAILNYTSFQLTGPSEGIGYCNRTLSILRFSRPQIVIPQGDTQAETVSAEVVITVKNEYREVRLPAIQIVRVRRSHTEWVWAGGVIGVLGLCVLARKKNHRERNDEVELQRFDVAPAG